MRLDRVDIPLDTAAQGVNPRAQIDGKRALRRRKLLKKLWLWRQGQARRQFGTQEHQAQLLGIFARNRQATRFAIPLLAFVAGGLSLLWLPMMWVGMWGCVASLGFVFVALSTRRVLLDLKKKRRVFSKQRRLLFSGSAALALVWSSFFLLGYVGEGAAGLGSLQFATLLVYLAVTTMLATPLPAAQLIATVPATVALVLSLANTDQPVSLVLCALALAAQAFFHMLTRQLHKNAVAMLAHRNEKDALLREMKQVHAISLDSLRRAEEANLAKSRFLATMSHELRTPLNAILGFSEVMKDEVLGKMENPTYLDYAQDIHSSGEHLLNLINEILDLSRVEAGRYELHEEALDLAAVVSACRHLVQMRASGKAIRIHEHYEETLPLLWADERSIRQMVLNLLSNAVKFTQEGGEICLRVGKRSTGEQYVCIRDNGPGIPEDELPVVMEAFGQGQQAIESAEQGTGLGLSIVQVFAELHGGSFSLRSKTNVGTEAEIVFPASRAASALSPHQTIGAGLKNQA